ncbi:MAG: sialidase family protein, partial [Planctomycetota bacterium]
MQPARFVIPARLRLSLTILAILFCSGFLFERPATAQSKKTAGQPNNPQQQRPPGAGPFDLIPRKLDLAAYERQRRKDARGADLFVAGNLNYASYRIPALLTTKQGTLLAFAEGRVKSASDHGNIDIVMRRSEDEGLTWKDQTVVCDNDDNVAGNPCPVIDKESGRIFLFFITSSNSEGEILKGRGARKINMKTSDDDGKTWSDSVDLTSLVSKKNWRWYATGPCSAIQIQTGQHQGRLLVPANHSEHLTNGKWEYRCHCFYSDDLGESWKIGQVSTAGGNESQIAEVAPNWLIQDIRMQAHGKGKRAFRFSRDGGATWSPLQHDPRRLCPRCQGSVLSIKDSASSVKRLYAANPAGPGRTNLTLYSSVDGAESWRMKQIIHSGPSAY